MEQQQRKQPPHIAISFMFKFAEYKTKGNNDVSAFKQTGELYKRLITAISISRRIGYPDVRKTFFNDGTSCTYKEGYFTIKS